MSEKPEQISAIKLARPSRLRPRRLLHLDLPFPHLHHRPRRNSDTEVNRVNDICLRYSLGHT